MLSGEKKGIPVTEDEKFLVSAFHSGVAFEVFRFPGENRLDPMFATNEFMSFSSGLRYFFSNR
jgi:hypothetical protein